MSVLEKATAHFSARMTNNLLKIDVPEWETKVFYRPSWSLKAQEPVNKLLAQSKQSEALAMTLIIRALDEEAKPMFRRADLTELMNKVDPEVVSRIVGEMSGEPLSEEEAVKN